MTTENQAPDPAPGCLHRRYSLDKHEQVGHCIDCGAEGRMVFVVNQAPESAQLPEPAGRHPEWDNDAQDYRPTGRHYTADQMRAALAAPAPQAAPVAWCELTEGGQIAYFDGKPMVMPGPVGNDCHPHPLYLGAAQASAPAHAALIRRLEAYQRGESQEITRILIDCLAALQAPAVGEREVLDLIATLEAEAHGALLHTAFVSQGLIYTTIKTLMRLAGIPESVVPVQGSES